MKSFYFPILSTLIFHVILVSGRENIKTKLKQIKFPLLALAVKLIIKQRPLVLHNMCQTLHLLTVKNDHEHEQHIQNIFKKKIVHAVIAGRSM